MTSPGDRIDPHATAWLDALTLPHHAELLRRLVGRVAREPAFRFVELCCSVARGAGDELSDLDLGLGVADAAWPDALTLVGPMLADLGGLVDLLEHRIAEWGDVPHRRFFAQYENGIQIDLVASPVSRRPGMPAGSVALYDPDGHLGTTFTSSLERATADDVREWAFLGWIALANLDKYARRGSLWEALAQLNEARTQLWRLLAVVEGARYPAFGMTSALDLSPPSVPTGLDQTVATLDPRDIRRAGRVLASMLGEISVKAAKAAGSEVPDAMAAFVSERLAEPR